MRVASLGFSLILIAFISACGVGLESNSSSRSIGNLPTTGAEKTEVDQQTQEVYQRPYTPAGRASEFESLKTQMQGKTDKDLAMSIKDVKVSIESEAKLNVRLQLDNQSQFYVLNLNAGEASGTRPQTQDLKDGSDYLLSAKCSGANCNFVQFHLKKIKDAKVFEAAFQYFVQKPKVKVQMPRSEDLKPKSALNEFKNSDSAITAEQVSVSIVDGPSYSNIQLIQDNKPIMSFNTDLLDTSDHTIVAKPEGNDAAPELQAEIVGNDPETGNLVMDIQAGREGAREAVRVTLVADEVPIVQKNKPVTVAQPKQAPAPLSKGRGILAPTTQDKDILATSLKFDEYINHPEVQKRIKNWTGPKSASACKDCMSVNADKATKFLTYIQPLEHITQKIFEAEKLSPEFAYLMAIESGFISEKYPIEVTAYRPKACGKCTAAGPWQITEGTAKTSIIERWLLPYKIFAIKVLNKLRILDSKDDRGYYVQSTHMGAKYLATLSEKNSHDPGLVLISYHIGPGATDRAMDKTEAAMKRHQDFDVTLSDLIQYRMAPANRLDYALNIVALRAVGQNPEQYGLKIKYPNNISAALKGKLANPNSKLPESITAEDLKL